MKTILLVEIILKYIELNFYIIILCKYREILINRPSRVLQRIDKTFTVAYLNLEYWILNVKIVGKYVSKLNIN